MRNLRKALRQDKTLIPRARAVLDLLMRGYPYEIMLGEIVRAGGYGGYRARISECRIFVREHGFDIPKPRIKSLGRKQTSFYKLALNVGR
ncbi:MAG TPA: hypothetical protein ENH82_14345 [bacterium]|nr:hypothetical protein [bacterium]